ncbi:EamA-like transporter family protein [Halopseudomonas xinjiangensis]|uniref:EamA-like transporter family protein n=1 Tax=Halopseudomonas xinjiangensis TaxID=487184 RepID=A0A1H1W1W3_9GAMM|nr:DMT family transporter [Halopseudomonas xinjiangensis]SDS91033.1 EamA-like transporter family protein [Halopseudomonas xinjiangensis]
MTSRQLAMAGLVICTLAWAGNALVARATAGLLPPISLSFWRWTTALLLLLPFTLRALWFHRQVLFSRWFRVAVLAALSISSYNTLLYLAAQSTTAINITLVNTGLPVAAFIWSIVLLRQWPTAMTLLGAVLSFLGLLVILTLGEPARLLTLTFNRGDLIMVVAVLAWGLYSVLLRKWILPVPGVVQLSAMLLFGVPLLLPFYLWELKQTGGMPLSTEAFLAVGYTAIFASLVAYLAWNNGVKVLGPATASLFSYLMPVFAALLSVALLGETLHWYHLAGGALTFLGLLLATWETRP